MAIYYKNICKNCGRVYSGRGKEFCSKSCANSNVFNPFYNKKHSDVTKKTIAKSRIGKSTGSGDNHWNWNGGQFGACPICGNLMNWRSDKCRKCYHELNKGKNHSQWQGGITKERVKIWKSPEYQLWRNFVFQRDNYTCQMCSNRSAPSNEVFLEAHHIKQFAKYPELRFVVDNGLTVCKKCHKNIHTNNDNRKKQNTRKTA